MLKKLQQYESVKKEIVRLEERIRILENRMYSPRATDLSNEIHNPTPGSNPMVDSIIVHIELVEKYKKLVEKLDKQQSELEDAIQQLEPTERELLRLRYFDGLIWRKVANKLGYEQRNVFNIHDKAVKNLAKILKK